MPRGSKPGERRGGRKRGTPNKGTVLTERILAAAAANPVATPNELLSILVDDQALPADTRIAVARKAFLIGASRPNSSRMGKSIGLAERPNESSRRSNGPADGNGQEPPKPAAVRAKADRATLATVVFLLSVAQDTRASPEGRGKAASQVAQFFLPKNPRGPRRRKFPPDECGFSVDPKLARELCDAKLKLACLPLVKRITPYAIAQRASKLQARIKEIQQSLQCPRPSKYKRKHWREDSRRLRFLTRLRAEGKVLAPEEDSELAHRMARLDSFLEGPEYGARLRLSDLLQKKRVADKIAHQAEQTDDQGNRQADDQSADQDDWRLTAEEQANFRLLSLLYLRPRSTRPDPRTLEEHPFVEPRFIVGNPNRPDGYLILGTPRPRKFT
jgi:hypothetical protein